MAEIAVILLAKNLKDLLSSKIDLSLEENDQIQTLYGDLQLLRTNLNDLQVKFLEHEQVKNLEARIRDLAYEAENTIDSFLVNIFSRKNIDMENINKDNSEEEIKKDRSFKFNSFLSKFLYRKRMKEIKKDRSLKDEIKEDGSLKPEIQHDHSLNLEHVKEEIEAIKTEMMGIYDMGLEATQVGSFSSSGNSNPTRANTNPTAWCALEEQIMVGFEDEALTLKEQLTRGPKQLEVISIVGMAGQGKTTLATKLYNDPLIVYHFHVRAWTSVSQEYRKRDLLLRLVSCVMPHTNRIDQMSDEKLAEMLYKSLKGRTYFIVMDDIWDTRAWLDLKICFPNDNNGSRIMFTSRHEDVALQAKPNSPPLSLRFLTHNESWDLFQHKVFGKRENCPPELVEIGKQITNKCQGLPLSIVVVAGIFINEEKSQDRWKQVGETLKSNLAANPQACMKTLALSYIHLPGHLKPCFLYFGAFPEDFQIPVWKLIWLWIAEGFIQKIGEKSLEDVAEEYLMDLIARSLVLVTRRAYDGGIKECSIHDLLRDFCLRKSEEEYFLQQISGNHPASSSSYFGKWVKSHFPAFNPLPLSQKRTKKPAFNHLTKTPQSKHFSDMSHLSICDSVNLSDVTSVITSAAKTRSFLYFRSGCTPWNSAFFPPNFSPPWFKLLRYLALSLVSLYPQTYLPDSISNLWNLETLILSTHILVPCANQLMNLSLTRQEMHKFLGTHSSVTLPYGIRKMVKLRHIRLTGEGINKIGMQYPHDQYPFLLDNLQTLSWVDPWSCRDLLFGTPNIRKLGFRGQLIDGGCLSFPHLSFLNHLQELKLFNTGHNCSSNSLKSIQFPPNLKKLTLKKTNLKWDAMSTLVKLLPNLEVLKLLLHACTGQHWETSDGEFPQLKLLKLESLEIMQWEVSSNHFPTLQRLQLVNCHGLENIPSEIGDIPTLQVIEVHQCNPCLANSAREIKEEQESMGNNWLQILIRTTNLEISEKETHLHFLEWSRIGIVFLIAYKIRPKTAPEQQQNNNNTGGRVVDRPDDQTAG
ncbi:hypothetical protein HYC85_023601 [Camellia sinensis]|uniref:NB-ARC domain-containing protein n=1 Tax=Camellia sinensis TaxID=4442 RepID=A0A7J7GF13_CAMSI|nr:hypothetical protein HYC85_023601 [Camellia sinensis]